MISGNGSVSPSRGANGVLEVRHYCNRWIAIPFSRWYRRGYDELSLELRPDVLPFLDGHNTVLWGIFVQICRLLKSLRKSPDCSRQNPQVTNQQDGEREHQKKQQPEEKA